MDTVNTIFITTGVAAIFQLIVYCIQKANDNRVIRELEDKKNQQQIRAKAEIIAELLSEWLSNPENLTQLHKLSFQAFLWLPDDIAIELSKLLLWSDDALSVQAIVVKVREHLLSKTEVKPVDIVTWSKDSRYGVQSFPRTFIVPIQGPKD